MSDSPPSRILIVEDDQTFRETVCEVLRDVGYKVKGARSVKRAAKRLNKHKYDLVLTDVNIGNESGLEVLQIASKKRPDTKIVLMSADADPELITQAKESGAVHFLPKPFRVNELLQTIQDLLEPGVAPDQA
ncbi:MAG: response regulator [Anaerolineae bacterium]|nr:response regulator [Anaerolineae bacterium]